MAAQEDKSNVAHMFGTARATETAPSSSSSSSPSAPFAIDYDKQAIAAQAFEQVYGKSQQSERSLDDPVHRDVLKSVFKAGYAAAGGRVQPTTASKTPILTRKAFGAWLDAEYSNFEHYGQDYIRRCKQKAQGNAFGQCLIDHVTPDSGQKHLVIGLQCIDPELRGNMTIVSPRPHHH